MSMTITWDHEGKNVFTAPQFHPKTTSWYEKIYVCHCVEYFSYFPAELSIAMKLFSPYAKPALKINSIFCSPRAFCNMTNKVLLPQANVSYELQLVPKPFEIPCKLCFALRKQG